MTREFKLKQLCAYCDEYADYIYVRDNFEGKWGNYPLSKLPADVAVIHVLRWLSEGVFPHRLKTPR